MSADGNSDLHDHFREISIDETLEEFATDRENGLSDEAVKEKRKEFGPNSLGEEESHPVKDFLQHFWGPIPWMLEVACILAAVAQRWEDFLVILAMLLINGGVSYWHESRAEDAIRALKQKLSPTARVIRNGKQDTLPSKKLVPGDIVIVKMGDVVPADVKFLEDQQVSIDESALTGESVPADKNGGDLGFSGTSVNVERQKPWLLLQARRQNLQKLSSSWKKQDRRPIFRKQ